MNRVSLSAIKRCSKCRRFRSVEAFGNSNRAVDGLQSQCRSCVSDNGKKWRERNPEKWRAARGRWKAANLDKVRAIHRNTSHKRYCQMKAGGLSAGKLLAWEAAQPKVCHWCGVKCSPWQVDHRLPLARGGAHDLSNLVISCATCNQRKGSRDPIEFARSLGRPALIGGKQPAPSEAIGESDVRRPPTKTVNRVRHQTYGR